FVLVSFLIINTNNIIPNIDDNSRISGILIGGGGSDASVLERKYTIFNAINNIYRNPVFGRYGEYDPGFYAHNILSVWSDYGIFVFFIFLFGMILSFRNSIYILIRRVNSNHFISMAIFSVSGIILFTFAKFYVYPIFGVMLALSAQYSQFCLDNKEGGS
ncbi:MAG TPA: hypothetical protein PLS50_08855, partial [Candidatus Dojkabacteria bacterium]|nr:hypothetical protein [Candidatus Dojkabacteria bacterium]